MKVVVILPTYNERENIRILLENLEKVSQEIPTHECVFLVVDDNSPDGTDDLIKSYQKQHANVFLISDTKQGLGKALLRGMTYAVEKLHADILVQMDADLSHDPQRLPAFLHAIDQGADFAVGSRYIRGGSIPNNWGIHRKIFSVVGNAIVRFGLGFPRIHDWTGGYRAYKRRFFEEAKSHVRKYSGYVFQIAFLHQAILHNAKIAEVPIEFTDRKFGRSKIAPTEYIQNVLSYVISERLRSLIRGTFGKFLVVGTIGFIINTVILELSVSFGVHPAVGSVFGAELAIISNFILNNRWTFRTRPIPKGKAGAKFFQFNASSLGALVIQGVSVWAGTRVWGLGSYRVFYVLGVGIGLIWNYTMYSRVIWKKSEPAGI
ncbi:MAG: glycosyltransferase family 2 protein [bacterium]|nr:glycosyltransferase family 2 protein [bacterium]